MKILKTLYTATLCAAMAVSTSSCLNSWLDQSPADGIDAETAIKNSDDLANVRTGLYAAVKGNSSLINYYGRLMFVYGDMRGEDIQYEYNGGSGRANFYYYMEYTTADINKSFNDVTEGKRNICSLSVPSGYEKKIIYSQVCLQSNRLSRRASSSVIFALRRRISPSFMLTSSKARSKAVMTHCWILPASL